MVGEGVWARLPKVVCFSIGVFAGGVGLETSFVGLIGLRVLCGNYACLSVRGWFGDYSFGGLIGLRVSQCMLYRGIFCG